MDEFKKLKQLAMSTSTASVADIMRAPHMVHMEGVFCQTPPKKMFGEAVTLRSLPFRPDVHTEIREAAGGKRSQYPFERALELCGEGKVLVIDSSGYSHAAVGGDVKFSRLHGLKAEGLVTDGAVRDKEDMVNFDFALFCSSFTPVAGTLRHLIGHDINIPIACGKVLVRPGDYVLGDATGVVVIPRPDAEGILKKAAIKEEINTYIQKRILEEGVNPGEYYPATPEIKERFARETGIPLEDIP